MRPRALFLALLGLALAAPAPALAHTSDGTGLVFSWPADGTVTSPYGWDGSRWHPGLDIGILRSLDVVAAAPGRVIMVGEQRGYEGYGSVVLVDLGSGLEALYAHLARPLVHVGQGLWTGDRLGIAGCTGWCTGTHLHFELRERGTAVDPTALMP
jgi:murein DD-endopeptidase MepM/ murein hydrolase activator NlpD